MIDVIELLQWTSLLLNLFGFLANHIELKMLTKTTVRTSLY